MERRLITIVAADLVGYSRLMAADEEGTLRRFSAVRSEMITPKLKAAGARLIKTMGDGLLIEFQSPVDAVRTTLEIQQAMVLREQDQPGAQKLQFRVGINLGDVIIDGDDILGDGVNVAARLESLAPHGGICISRAVHEQLRGKIDAVMTPIGPQNVKNIPDPIEVWRVEIDGLETPAVTAEKPAKRSSIAVLPFTNMSSDPEKDFLADGIVEDVITELSRFRSLFVIARNSTFAYKGTAKDVREIATELGVEYVIEGSVRSSGDRLRVTAQLIDGDTGAHLWAERWDRLMDDLFAVQDELTRAIVSNVEPELGANERSIARRKPTEILTAWELYQRGITEYLNATEESYEKSLGYLHRAIDADPNFSLPHALLARWYFYRVLTNRVADREIAIAAGLDHASKAIKIDSRDESGYAGLSLVLSVAQREREAEAALLRCEALNPNSPTVSLARTVFHMMQQEVDCDRMEAAALRSISQDPRSPNAWSYQMLLGTARFLRNRDVSDAGVREAFEAAASHGNAEYFAFFYSAICNVSVGRKDQAQMYINQALAANPTLSAANWQQNLTNMPSSSGNSRVIETYLDDLVALGLPLE